MMLDPQRWIDLEKLLDKFKTEHVGDVSPNFSSLSSSFTDWRDHVRVGITSFDFSNDNSECEVRYTITSSDDDELWDFYCQNESRFISLIERTINQRYGPKVQNISFGRGSLLIIISITIYSGGAPGILALITAITALLTALVKLIHAFRRLIKEKG